jgi:hypothetical protein
VVYIFNRDVLKSGPGVSLGRVLPGSLVRNLWGETVGQIDAGKMKDTPTVVRSVLMLNWRSGFLQVDGSIDASSIS